MKLREYLMAKRVEAVTNGMDLCEQMEGIFDRAYQTVRSSFVGPLSLATRLEEAGLIGQKAIVCQDSRDGNN